MPIYSNHILSLFLCAACVIYMCQVGLNTEQLVRKSLKSGNQQEIRFVRHYRYKWVRLHSLKRPTLFECSSLCLSIGGVYMFVCVCSYTYICTNTCISVLAYTSKSNAQLVQEVAELHLFHDGHH